MPPSQTPCSAYSTDSLSLPFVMPVVSSHCSLENGVRFVVFSDESRFCLGASDDRVLVRRTGERHQLNCLRPRLTEPTPGVTDWREISYDSRSTLVVTLQ
ncbi:uncharacterized protein TNCV_2987711 [Trichonephila clavipes]|nr:uncharacterized protein TNCV_2987711 [Trichonephila clavipes]